MPYLQDYKNLLQKTAIHTKMGSWELDIANNTVYWSDVTKKIHEVDQNYTCDVNEAINFYKDPHSRELITHSLNEAIDKKINFDVKLKITTASNKTKWVRAIGIPVFEKDKCTSVYGLFQDIDETEIKQQELDKQIQITNDIFLNTSIGIVICKLDGKIVKVNKGLAKILGYTISELKKLTYKDFTHPDDLQTSIKGIQELNLKKVKSFSTEKRYIKKNGEIAYVFLVLSSILDRNKQPTQLLGQVIDLTDQYKSKQELTSYLNITKDQNQRLLNFAHIVSHNLKSHSGNLKMLLELINIEYPELNENELIPLFSQAVDSLSDTVKHLNEVVMVHTSDKKSFQSLNLYKYISKTIESLSALIKLDDVGMHLEVDMNLNIKAIPAYLESVLLNLLSNAIKYKSPNRKLIIQILTFIDDEFVTLQVIDNGLGIDLNKHRSKIFGMYKTFHNHKESRGIGLFITKNQIEAMGGSIDVQSEVNKGSKFIIKFKK